MNDPAALRAALLEALGLKEVDREGWRRVGVERPESVAAHSWGVAWLVLALAPGELDIGRALALAVVHDLSEVRTGDRTPADGVPPAVKAREEGEAFRGLVGPLPHRDRLLALWEELERGQSAEARFVKACDRLDMALQADRYAASRGIDPAEFRRSALEAIHDLLLRRLAGGE